MNYDYTRAFAQDGQRTDISDADYKGGWYNVVGGQNGIPTTQQFNAIMNEMEGKTNDTHKFTEKVKEDVESIFSYTEENATLSIDNTETVESEDVLPLSHFDLNGQALEVVDESGRQKTDKVDSALSVLSDIVYKKTVNSGIAADSDPNTTTLAKVRTKHENCPTSDTVYTIITAFTDGTAEICEKFQYAINVGIKYGKIYFRSKVYGLTTWTDWKEITTTDKVTAEQIGLGNVPNVTTNDQTPTYTVASTLTELESGEKLSIAFGKIAKAISTLISHISTKATASVLGHVKLSDSSAVTDSTGLALAATEKNASIAGTLAYQIINKTAIKNGNYQAVIQGDGNLVIYNTAEGTSIWDSTGQKAVLSALIARVTILETVSDGAISKYTDAVTIVSQTIRKQGNMVTFDAIITYSGSTLNDKTVLYISQDIIPTVDVHLMGINGTTGMAYRFVIEAGSNLIRGVSITANSTYTAGQQVCITGSWSVG